LSRRKPPLPYGRLAAADEFGTIKVLIRLST